MAGAVRPGRWIDADRNGDWGPPSVRSKKLAGTGRTCSPAAASWSGSDPAAELGRAESQFRPYAAPWMAAD